MLILFSLAVQLGFLFCLFDPSVYFYKYWELALRLRGLIAPPIGVFYSSPFYISLMTLGQGVGLNYLDFKIVQAFVGALSCWLIYETGNFFFNRAVALLASLAAVVYLPFILYNISFLPAVWVITFNLLSLISLAKYFQKKRLPWLAVAGLAIGLSIITRPNFVIFLVLLILFLILSPRKSDNLLWEGFSSPTVAVKNRSHSKNSLHNLKSDSQRKATVTLKLKQIGIILIPALLVILPVSLFNYSHSGEFIPVTASGGWVFYCANNPRVKGFDFSPPPEFDIRLGYYYSLPGNKLNYVEHLLNLQLAREKTGRDLKPAEASRYWRNQGMDFIRRNPGAYLSLLGKKLLAALNGYEPHDVPEVLQRYHRLKSLPLLTLRIILPLALLGFIIGRPRSAGILYLYLSSYVVSFLIMYVTPRFRLPVVPVLLLLAAAAVVRLYNLFCERRWPVLARNILFLVPLAILVQINTKDIKRDREITRPAFLHEWKGLTLMKQEEWEPAGEEFKKALKLNPDSYRARQGLEMIKDRGQMTEDRRQRPEDRGQRTEDRRQRTEDRRQKTEVGLRITGQ